MRAHAYTTCSYFRIKMVNSKLYRRGAVKRNVPYRLILKRYWPTLIGTAGTCQWQAATILCDYRSKADPLLRYDAGFLYDMVTFPAGIFRSVQKGLRVVSSACGIKFILTLHLQLCHHCRSHSWSHSHSNGRVDTATRLVEHSWCPVGGFGCEQNWKAMAIDHSKQPSLARC